MKIAAKNYDFQVPASLNIHPQETARIQTGIASIDSLDLSKLRFKAMQMDGGYGWSAESAHAIGELYRVFLFLCLTYPDEHIVPPREVDEFWHLHILDTRAYHADCEAIFGSLLHHFPYAGLPGANHPDEEALIHSTLERVRRHFPEIL